MVVVVAFGNAVVTFVGTVVVMGNSVTFVVMAVVVVVVVALGNFVVGLADVWGVVVVIPVVVVSVVTATKNKSMSNKPK